MRNSHHNTYAGYTIDDWNWEFLKRNQRYKRAYKAVQWLKARLDRKASPVTACFSAFGILFGKQFRFTRVDRGNGWEWCYHRNGKHSIHLNDLSSPNNPSSRRYKGKLIKKLKAVTLINGLVDGHGNDWQPALLQEHEIAVQIDTRFGKKEIISSVEKLLACVQSNKKPHLQKYKDYPAVWDLRQQGKPQKEIATTLWPRQYQKKGGPDYDTGEKGSLVQRVSDHQKRAQELIEASIRTVFPPKKRSPKSRNKP